MGTLFQSVELTCIVPVSGTPPVLLRECLESIRRQSFYNFEILLVDDKSGDAACQILAEYVEKDSRFHIIHRDGITVSDARNAGLKRVKGKYVTFVDADDILQEDAWLVSVEALGETGAGCAVFGWRNMRPSLREHEFSVCREGKVVPAIEAICGIAGDDNLYGGGYPWNKVWRTSAIRKEDGGIPEFPPDLISYEDKYWTLEVLMSAETVCLVPRILYQYNYSGDSLSNTVNEKTENLCNSYYRIVRLLEGRGYHDAAAAGRKRWLRFASNRLSPYPEKGMADASYRNALIATSRYWPLLMTVGIGEGKRFLVWMKIGAYTIYAFIYRVFFA